MSTSPEASRAMRVPGQRATGPSPARPAAPSGAAASAAAPPRAAREQLLAPGEVAALFGVDAKTVSRWEKTGRLSCIRTLGGHRRFLRSQVDELLARVDPPRG